MTSGMAKRTEPPFLPALLLLLSGFIIWAGHFGAIYGYAGLLCARPEWAQMEIAGIGLIPLGIAALTLIALAGLAAVLFWADLLPPQRDSSARSGEAPFYRAVTLGAALLGGVGILWQGIFSILFVAACY